MDGSMFDYDLLLVPEVGRYCYFIQGVLMRKITFNERMRYAFDNTMSRGTPALIAWLGIISLGLVFIVSLVVYILRLVFADDTEVPSGGFFRYFWMSLMRTLDPGTMGGDEGNVFYLLTMLGVTLGGIFIVSTLIGVLSSGIESKIEELRKGRSFVIEEGHTLILGWSEQIYTVIRELAVANANQKKPCIVILANKDKVEMEDEVRAKVGDTGKTRIICRTGSPLDLDDLEIVNPQGARSIIVLSPNDEDPDSQVIKTILAITNSARRRKEPYHIVAEIHDAKNMEAARLVGGQEVQLIDVGDTIARLIAQTCRQSGLSVVYTELLDFGGDEIYFKEEPALVGKTFGESLLMYEASTLIGLHTDNLVMLNPPMNAAIKPGDKIIAISQDDDTIKLSGHDTPPIETSAIQTATTSVPQPERILIMGWNRRAPTIINELDNYVAPGSEVTVIADHATGSEDLERFCAECENLTVRFRRGDTTDRRTIDALQPDTYQHIVVLCYSDALDPQRADARTLITLLHLRDIEAIMGERFSIVSEMLDDRNRELAEVTQADDFIVSDKLLSLMLAQISENKHLKDVFTDIFDPEGSEIYVKPASDYVALGRPVNFYTVVEAARRRGHIAIGYTVRAQESDAEKGFGVVVNPPKSGTLTFSAADRVVVIAED
jgi:ion channel POLLUX/CASTOR